MKVGFSFPGVNDGTHGVVYGLDVAIKNLVTAFCKYSGQETLDVIADGDAPEQFMRMATGCGISPHVIQTYSAKNPQHFFDALDVIFHPDPLLTKMAWQRAQGLQKLVPLCGVVHTPSTERVMQAMVDLALAPTFDCDALVCPSRALASSVQELWAGWGDYLAWRLGKKFVAPLHTPVIPLGTDVAAKAALAAPALRSVQRQQLALGDDDVVLLFVGRLSFATKTHPISMLMAAEEAAIQLHGQKNIHLIMYGYFEPALMEKPFQQLAKQFCTHATVHFIQNNDARFPQGLWAGADIFLSLIDNIQESFGLTPVEAMACGLPAIISDWDGYKDTVKDGETGFLIPTCAPTAVAGHAIAHHYFNNTCNYGEMLSSCSQSTAIDIQAAAIAIVALAGTPALRQRMGDAAAQRAHTMFDWPVVMAMYRDLWAAQKASAETLHAETPMPTGFFPASHPNPFRVFQSYPSTTLQPHTTLMRSDTAPAIMAILQNPMNFFMPNLLLPPDQMEQLSQHFSSPASVATVLNGVHDDIMMRSLGWLLKFGVLHVV
ncbi:MAG: glycosyltransferase [Alphaproteobacteria bacterium]|nr:glycosyltransferase [Alphaproteobacteria bacterium]